jgi:hypothetical protein
MKHATIVVLVLAALLVAACGAEPTPTATPVEAAPTATAGSTIQPLPTEVCNGQAQAMSHTLDDLVPTQSQEPLDDPITNAKGTGCQATVTGTGVQFEGPVAVVNALGSMLEDEGWTVDPMLQADGPMGTAAGYRKGDQICMAAAIWEPDDSANCPQDQPISACQVKPEQQLYTVTLNCGLEAEEGQAIADVGSEQLVFDSTRGGVYRDLYVMNRDGYDVSRLTRGEADSLAGPWSPDGQRIVYTTFGLTTSDIAVINADGSGQVNLTNSPDIDEGFPAWSPDGRRIAFTTRRDGNNEIYLMDADGSNSVRLTDEPGDDFAPAWSPDGSRIAFVSDRDREAGIYDLYIMNADGSGVTRLTDDPAIDYSPAWSPDGTRIAFRSHHDGPADIYVINVDGSGLHNLTENPADDWAPSWSPDGRLIAFQTNRDGNWEVYVMNADGTGLVNLTQNPADDQLPFWRLYPVPQSQSEPAATSPSAPGEWPTYVNAEAGFSIQVPPTWSQQTLPDQNSGAIHGEAFAGQEGSVEVYWGVGFGGACPTGRDPVELAEVVTTACHATSSDGTETWNQIDYVVSGGNAFSNRAYTSNAQPASHDLVLQVLSTLRFMPPE